MQLFDRVVEITVGKPGAADAVQIKDLRVTFTVNKDKNPSSNTAEIEIYNLSEARRNQINELDEQVMIKAGYGDAGGAQMLFLGDIVKVNHSHQPPDFITHIEANDAGKALREIRISLSYGDNTSALKILKDIIEAFKLAKRSVPSVKDKPYVHGFAAHGSAKNAMDTVTRRLGLEWSIQNGEIKVVTKGGADDSESVLISPDTGLIGRVEKLAQTQDEADPKKKRAGWKAVSLLQPKVEPGGVVALKSRDIPQETSFRVERVSHRGDTHGREWQSEIEVVEMSS